jgi:hypothetical protein
MVILLIFSALVDLSRVHALDFLSTPRAVDGRTGSLTVA